MNLAEEPAFAPAEDQEPEEDSPVQQGELAPDSTEDPERE